MHLGMNYGEVRELPIRYRRWFIERLSKHFKDRNSAREEKPDTNSSNMKSFGDYQEMLNKKFK